MLFNSYTFIFIFLPVVLAGYQLSYRFFGNTLSRLWLAAASLFFYGWWNPKYTFLVVFSIVFNFVLGTRMMKSQNMKRWLIVGIIGNLSLLGYFKYAHFLATNLSELTGLALAVKEHILPIGISFFTFTQIAYLVDLRKGRTEDRGPLDYALFVTFFPHLIAGPIVHHRELASQFDTMKRLLSSNMVVGLGLFSLGLFKKVVIADNLAPSVDSVYGASEIANLSQAEAWYGTLAYTFQLYFDFSGYADMAVGLSRMFGVAMPCNFASPYKSTSIIDFWRRWHMTLSKFVRDYLYIPLGGSHCGWLRNHTNLLVVMVIMGLWHGAGWAFVVWGAVHGSYLVLNHAWATLSRGTPLERFRQSALWRKVSLMITFIAVASAWVIFRADSLHDASLLLQLMYGLEPGGNGSVLPDLDWRMWAVLLALLLAVWLLPNSQEIVGVNELGESGNTPAWQWIFNKRGAVLAAAMMFAALILMQRPSPFLYFQF